MDTNSEIQRAQQSLQKGDRKAAQSILATVIRTDPKNIKAWLVLSIAVDSDDQRKDCLNKVLQLDPTNADAHAILGGSQVQPVRGQTSNFMSQNFVLGVFAFLFIIFIGGGFGWWYAFGPCGKVSVQNSSQQLLSEMKKYVDATQLAGVTPRIALSIPINNLQTIKSETENIEVPDCMVYGKGRLLSSMNAAIQGDLAFEGNEADVIVSGYYQNSSVDMKVASRELLAIVACAPFCNYQRDIGLVQK